MATRCSELVKADSTFRIVRLYLIFVCQNLPKIITVIYRSSANTISKNSNAPGLNIINNLTTVWTYIHMLHT